jgi:acyl carrier protein
LDYRNIEDIVKDMWLEAFKKNEISTQEDFFDLGGHSLMAAQLVTKMRETFKVNISLLTFFDNSSIESLAERIYQLRAEIENVDRNEIKK